VPAVTLDIVLKAGAVPKLPTSCFKLLSLAGCIGIPNRQHAFLSA
jgi:hypothetical protein